ncbi:hypothetical protein EVAR_81148_1 [Eumeta japonica]|uniref:Uncharacterized protein n=1 Tax=Eumeta variegata TaxID=151549 RepID=A0A4C1UK06_EUMVA|nr:hypothetical protein EVAR_81148_1 [Eumeta japonica]
MLPDKTINNLHDSSQSDGLCPEATTTTNFVINIQSVGEFVDGPTVLPLRIEEVYQLSTAPCCSDHRERIVMEDPEIQDPAILVEEPTMVLKKRTASSLIPPAAISGTRLTRRDVNTAHCRGAEHAPRPRRRLGTSTIGAERSPRSTRAQHLGPNGITRANKENSSYATYSA